MLNFPTLHKIRGNPPPHTQQTNGPPPPPTPLSRPVRCIKPALHIIGDAVRACLDLIPARWGPMLIFPTLQKIRGNPHTHIQQSNGPLLPPTPLSCMVRCVEPPQCIIGNMVCACLDLIQARGGGYAKFSNLAENKGKSPQHT
jgi:hypothetical protein